MDHNDRNELSTGDAGDHIAAANKLIEAGYRNNDP